MPAAAIKGIIISISLITALGVAVLENPEVQRWLEQQRKNLVELLRSIGSELDPQSRREAEAFAFEGRTPNNDPMIRREMEASRSAAAVATGRSVGSPSAVRRIPVRGPTDESAAEERRRQGREYLAKRNQQMYELHQRRKEKAIEDGLEPPPTPTFDSIVDSEGKLRTPDKELPSPPASEPMPEMVQTAVKQAHRQLEQPMLEGEASSSSAGSRGWNLGAALANPFADDFEMERSITPKPPVPPKVELDREPVSASEHEEPTVNHDELSYEEQLAIALSLSEAESSKPSATVRQTSNDEQDTELRAAIEASLRDLDHHQAAHMIANAEPTTPRLSAAASQPLVDLTPDPPTSAPQALPRGTWQTLFDQPNWADERGPADPPVSVPAKAEEEDDELYRVTPQLTRARLATLDAEQSTSTLPYDPVHEAANQPIEASFYSAQSRSTSPPTAGTLPQPETSELVDVSEEPASASGARTPTSRSSFAFHSDLESESDSFASVSHAPSVARSEISQPQPATPHSERSEIEVVDVADGEDSDVDILSEDGIATPDSWTEVGSRDGESEVSEVDAREPARATL